MYLGNDMFTTLNSDKKTTDPMKIELWSNIAQCQIHLKDTTCKDKSTVKTFYEPAKYMIEKKENLEVAKKNNFRFNGKISK